MPQVDIAAETLKVGNALTSVRIDRMILNLAKGIAWGQYELDKVGVDITKMMAVPGTVSIGGENLSMLDAGFIPSFYHFVDTILELKMEVNIREEQSTSLAFKQSTSRGTEVEASAEVGMKASGSVGFGPFSASAEVSAKAGWSKKSTSAYSRSLNAEHSQKFNQDLSASSLMRTKLVPVPPPEVLVERIKILLEKLREEAEDEDAAQVLFTIEVTDDLIAELDDETAMTLPKLKAAFEIKSEREITLESLSKTIFARGSKWVVKETVQETTTPYFIQKDSVRSVLKVYSGGVKTKSQDERLMGKVEEQLLELDRLF